MDRILLYIGVRNELIYPVCFVIEFVTVYTGMETENVIDRLSPGTQYDVRICCETAGGRSDFSDTLAVTTEAVCPGQCATPRLHGKPRPYSLALKWRKFC